MTLQEIYDKVAEALIRQGVAATDYTGRCRYRFYTSDGRLLKCAIGHLIPDEDYDPAMEEKAVHDILIPNQKLMNKLFGSEHSNALLSYFISNLQDAHDSEFWEGGLDVWKDAMRSLAKKYNLDPRVLNKDFL